MALTISGPASALLLLTALLAAGARADWVTTAECAARRGWGRVRQYPVDQDADTIDLAECNLTSIQQRTLTGLPALTQLWLAENKLRKLPVFDKLACPNLTWLGLASNQLTEINNGAFSACTQLETLSLSDNQIEFIHYSVFTALTNLRELYLHSNKIRYIPDQMFSNNGKLEKLHLNGNRISSLPLDFASSLKRASAGLKLFHFHDNPWHCACLIELLADVRRACVRDYNKWAYVGRAPVCRAPTGLPRAARGGR